MFGYYVKPSYRFNIYVKACYISSYYSAESMKKSWPTFYILENYPCYDVVFF